MTVRSTTSWDCHWWRQRWRRISFCPMSLSAMFWVWRIDLLTLPVFVAGAVAIIFGVRVLWRQKLAVCYLSSVGHIPYSVSASEAP